MGDPIKEAAEVEETTDALIEEMERAKFRLHNAARKFINFYGGNPKGLSESLGGIRGLVQILNNSQIPKPYTPYIIEAQAPFFQETTHKGREALRATVVIEILCLKEDKE